MGDNIKKFLERNANSAPAEHLPKFVDLLKASTSTALSVSKITRFIFEIAGSTMSEADQAKLKWAEGLINTLQMTSLRPTPRLSDTLFFPDPASEQKLIEYLDLAKRTMEVCVFTITNNHLRDALVRAHRRNVAVKIISDDECMKQQGSDIQFLRDSGIQTEIDTNPDAHMHNKFVVIDGDVLITGSFNWTVAAVNNNQENLVVINDQAICEKYIDYFEGLWRNFRPVEVQRIEAATKIQSNYRGNAVRKNMKNQ